MAKMAIFIILSFLFLNTVIFLALNKTNYIVPILTIIKQ